MSDFVNNAYTLHEKLGEGGMGVVYRATHRLSGRQVALKRVHADGGWAAAQQGASGVNSSLPPSAGPSSELDGTPDHDNSSPDAQSAEPKGKSAGSLSGIITTRQLSTSSAGFDPRIALAREFQTLSSLHHPYIVNVLDYGFDTQKQPFFTMELLESPKTILDVGRYQSVLDKAELLVQLLQALAYAHRRNIVHRDIKPSNVLVVNNQVKLVDFGIAGLIDSGLPFAGTLEYMAPELFLGQPANVASDLFALGMLAFQLFTDRLPRKAAQNHTSFLNELLGEEDRTLSPDVAELLETHPRQKDSTRPDLPGDESLAEAPLTYAELDESVRPLFGILTKLTAQDPGERYQDALQVIHDLSAALGQGLSTETEATRESFLQAAEFVGREQELAMLLEDLRMAQVGRGSITLVSGESGVGKSRLIAELRTRAMVRSVRVVMGQASSERTVNYRLWGSVLRELCLEIQLTAQEIGILQDIAPDLGGLLGQSATPPPKLTPQAAQERLHEAVENVLLRQETPVLVILEDLHWAGTESLELLAHLNQVIRKVPVLVLGNYRDDEASDTVRALPAQRLMKLERLGKPQVAHLVKSMLGTAGRSADLVDYLHQQTEGNVFFLVEVVRALADRSGDLGRVGHHDLPAQMLTGGIEQLVDRRLEQVSPDDYELLRLAAVAGRRLDLAVLHIAGAIRELDAWLGRCANATLLEAVQGEWQFVHDKIRERLLKRLNPEESRTHHRSIAESIITVHGEDATYAAMLAHHYSHGGVPEKAYRWYVAAGQEAARLYAVLEARTHYAGALSALALLPLTRENRLRKVDTLFLLMEISLWAESSEKIAAQMSESEALLVSLQEEGDSTREDHARLANAYFWLGRSASVRSEYNRSIALCQKAIEVARACREDRLIAVSSGMIGRLLLLQGHFGKCWPYLTQALSSLNQQRPSADWGRINATQGMSLVARGQVRLGLHYIQQTLLHTKDPTLIATGHMYMTMAYLFAQDWAEMLKSAQQCVAAGLQTKDELQVCAALWMCGWAESWLGQHAESAEHRAQARAIFDKRRNVLLYDWCCVAEADATLNAGEPTQAIIMAEQAIASARTLDGIYGEGLAHRTWGRALMVSPTPDIAAAERHLRNSLDLFERGEAHLAVAYTRMLLGELLGQRGELAAALQQLEQARAQFQSAELVGSQDQAAAHIAQLRSSGAEATRS